MKRFLFFMLLANLPLKGICLEYDYSFETSQNQIILQSILISVIDFSSEDKIRDQLNLWFQEGMPDIKQLVRLPDRGKIEVSVDVQEFENIEVNEDIRYNYSNILKITERSVYQIHPFTISDPAILGNNRIVSIHFPPFEISENLSDIRLIKRLEFRITVHPETGINEISDHKYYLNSSINRLLANLLGYAQNELDSELPFQPKAVVVLRNSPQLMGILQPWFEWKNEKGWELELLTEEDVPDWNRFEIRDELVRRYNEAENPFQYVVIVGDSEGPFSVPPGSAGIEGQGMYGAGDHAYSTLVGDDVLPDVGLGRISVEQLSELRTYVNKVLEYEKLAGDQGDWLSRGMVSAGSEVSGVSTIYLGRYARDLMLAGEYANVDTAWY
ncbi:hypothetical protein K8I28_09545, partial [bacterium]|nr:hypothetical protein [bacterium]